MVFREKGEQIEVSFDWIKAPRPNARDTSSPSIWSGEEKGLGKKLEEKGKGPDFGFKTWTWTWQIV